MTKLDVRNEIFALLKKMSKKQSKKDVEMFLEKLILEASQRWETNPFKTLWLMRAVVIWVNSTRSLVDTTDQEESIVLENG